MAARGVENPKRRARSRLKPTTHDDIVGTEPTTPTAAAGCSSKMSAMSDARPDLHEFARLRGDADQGDCLHWHETPEGASLNDWWVALLYNTLDALFPDA